MADNYHWMENFRTKNTENVYVLQVRVMEEGVLVKKIEEVVDCPKGEAGVWYANNLLSRLANEAVKGTQLETYPWREARGMGISGASKNYQYRKVKDSDNCARAEMEWHETM